MTAMRAEMIAGRTDKINRAGDGPIPDLAVIDLPETDLPETDQIAIGQQASHHGGHETERNAQILVMIAGHSAAPKDAMTARQSQNAQSARHAAAVRGAQPRDGKRIAAQTQDAKMTAGRLIAGRPRAKAGSQTDLLIRRQIDIQINAQIDVSKSSQTDAQTYAKIRAPQNDLINRHLKAHLRFRAAHAKAHQERRHLKAKNLLSGRARAVVKSRASQNQATIPTVSLCVHAMPRPKMAAMADLVG